MFGSYRRFRLSAIPSMAALPMLPIPKPARSRLYAPIDANVPVIIVLLKLVIIINDALQALPVDNR